MLLLLLEQKIEITYFQLFLIGVGIGFVLGLIPLILGFYKKKVKLGLLGFISTIAGGAIWSVVAVVVAIVFVVLLFVTGKPSPAEVPSESVSPEDS